MIRFAAHAISANIMFMLTTATSILNAECVCQCVNERVKVVCKHKSDIEPVCMPYMCRKDTFNDFQKFTAPEPAKPAKLLQKRCRKEKKDVLNGTDILSREECH